MLRCPLCLTILDAAEAVATICLVHERVIRHPGGSDLLGSLKDACHDNCRAGNSWSRDSIVALHIGCAAQLDYDELQRIGANPTYKDPRGVKHPIDHWQLGMLNAVVDSRNASLIDYAINHDALQRPTEASTSGGGADTRRVAPMCYPLALLQACRVQETWATSHRARFVELCGTPRSGKTLIALQAMDWDGYQSPSRQRQLALRDFIYISSSSELESSALFENLAARSRMSANEPWSPLGGTAQHPFNVKAIRITPAQGADAAREEATPNVLPRGGTWREMARKTLMSAVRDLIGREGQAEPRILVFHDTAGEIAHREEDQHLLALSKKVDVVAVVLDGDGLWGPAPATPRESPLLAAHRRLEEAVTARRTKSELRACIVVTKLDIHSQDTAEVCRLAERNDDQSSDERRQWLKAALQKRIKSGVDKGHAERLMTIVDAVDHVFLVWTDGAHLTGQLDPPRSHGLVTFLCWCLEESEGALFGCPAGEA